MAAGQRQTLRNWTGTVHYSVNGSPLCGRLATDRSWLAPSVATVTCRRCLALGGPDEPGHADPTPAYYIDEHAARRAAERADRRSR